MAGDHYLHWSQAGGPNECEHGYAEGIPCPNCDANPRIQELRAENERLTVELAHRVGWEERALLAEAALHDAVKSTGGALIVQDYARLNQALGQR